VVLVADKAHADQLIALHEEEQAWEIEAYANVLGKEIAVQYEEPFPWRVAWWE
jgi:hypothetical protein